MRALLVYPRLEPSFWSLPVANRWVGAATLAPPLGLITVAALLPASWELRFVDMNARDLTESDWSRTEIVLLSGMLAQRESMLDLIRQGKRRGKCVVTGGAYPTSIPEEPLEAGADYVVRGEAEGAVPDLLDALRGSGGNKVIQAADRPDLTHCPVPRFDLLHLSDYQFVSIQTSRGCPFDCEFCDVVHLFGRRPRYKAPEQVVGELETLYRLGYRGAVFFADDNFIGNRSRALDILRAVTAWQREHGEPFGCLTQASLDLGRDNEMIDAMTAANFGEVFIGIESPDHQALTISNKRQNIRNEAVESIRNINANGLTVLGSFIVGLDGEHKGADRRICDLIEEAAIPIAMINLLRAPPGTKLWKRLEMEGRLRHTWDMSAESSCLAINFEPSRPEGEIQEEFVRVWDRIYEPRRFLARTYRYYLTMRPTRAAIARRAGLTTGQPTKSYRPPLRKRRARARGLLFLMWRQGLVRACRFQFWRQMYGMTRRNPSRLTAYLLACGLGEDMMLLRKQICRERGAGAGNA
jgi:radical SAM superfamily enzyme YgiQ (UPF0313 family)